MEYRRGQRFLAPVRSSVLEIDTPKRLLFRVPALFGENARENDFNVVGTASAFGVWRTLVLHNSGFLRTSEHGEVTS